MNKTLLRTRTALWRAWKEQGQLPEIPPEPEETAIAVTPPVNVRKWWDPDPDDELRTPEQPAQPLDSLGPLRPVTAAPITAGRGGPRACVNCGAWFFQRATRGRASHRCEPCRLPLRPKAPPKAKPARVGVCKACGVEVVAPAGRPGPTAEWCQPCKRKDRVQRQLARHLRLYQRAPERVLRCQTCRMEFTRPAQTGRLPKACPECRANTGRNA